MECLMLALVYAGSARLSQVFAIPPGNITPIWLPSGIILAVILRRGYWLWPGIFLGAFVGNIWAYFSSASAAVLFKGLLAATANGVGDSLCAVVAVWLIQWPGTRRDPLHRASDMIRLIGYGGVLGTGISAACGVGILALAGILPLSQSGEVLCTWWIGDGMGVLLLTPLLLAWCDGFRGCRFGCEEIAAVGCLTAFGLWLAPQAEVTVTFLALPLLMWIACRCDSRVALSFLAAFAAMKIGVLAFGGGPFQGENQNLNLINLQLLLAILIVPMLILHAAFDGRESNQGGERPARTVFVAISLMLAAGIVTTGVWYFRSLARKHHAAVEQELVFLAQSKVDQLSRYREERLADGRVLFHNAAIAALARRVLETPTDAGASRELKTWLGKYQSAYQYNRVFLLDSQGVTRMTVPEPEEPVAALILQQSGEILRSDRVVLQDFYRNESNQDVYLAVMVPIFDESQPARPPLGLLVLRIDPDVYLNPLIQRSSKSSPTSETLLLRREGNEVVYLNDLRFRQDAALNLRVPLQRLEIPAVQAVLGHSGFIQGVDYRGVPVLSVALALPDSPWYLVTKVDAAEAQAPMHRQFWQVFGVVGMLLFSVAGGAGLIWWQQLDRFHRERAAVAQLLENSHRMLTETEEVGKVGGWEFNVLTGQQTWTEEIYRIHELDRTFNPTVDTGVSFYTPDSRPTIERAVRAAVMQGESFDLELEIITAKGNLRWVKAIGHADLKHQRVYGFFQDITERKQVEAALQVALADKVVLLKEIHHRVKNNLQIVSSLLNLQANRIASSDAKSALLDMRGRVGSMALIHEHLYRSDNLAAVDLAAYLRSLCTQLVRSSAATSGTIRLQMDLAPGLLGIDKAIPCGLLVNELVTNALKHAYPDGRCGVLCVGLQPLEGGPVWHLRVADDGVGLPPGFDLAHLTSLGLKVVGDLARQLGGRLEIGAGPGAVFEVEFCGNDTSRPSSGRSTAQ